MNRFGLAVDYYIHAKKIVSLMKPDYYDFVWASEACAYIPALLYKAMFHVPVFWSVFDPLSLVDKERPGMIIHSHPWFAWLLKIHNIFDIPHIRQIDKVIVSSYQLKKRMDSYYKIDSKVMPVAGVRLRLFTKKNYLKIVQYRLRKLGYKRQVNDYIIISTGHFLPHRRYEDIILALSILRNKFANIKLIISGSRTFDPNYFTYISNLVKSEGLINRVILDPNFKSEKEVIGYYQLCDLFIFAGYKQNWGLAPLEALAQSKPVIVSTGAEISEVLTNKLNAVLVPPKEPKKLASAIEYLFNNKSKAKELSKNGNKFVKSTLTYSQISKNVLEFISLYKT